MNMRLGFEIYKYGFVEVMVARGEVILFGKTTITVPSSQAGILALLINDAKNNHQGLSLRTIQEVLGSESEASIRVQICNLRKSLNAVEIAPGVGAGSLIPFCRAREPIQRGEELRPYKLDTELINQLMLGGNPTGVKTAPVCRA